MDTRKRQASGRFIRHMRQNVRLDSTSLAILQTPQCQESLESSMPSRQWKHRCMSGLVSMIATSSWCFPDIFAVDQTHDPDWLEISDGNVQRLTVQSPYGNKV